MTVQDWIGWRSVWRVGHRTPYGWCPHYMTADYTGMNGAGAALALNIGFPTKEECDAWIAENLTFEK